MRKKGRKEDLRVFRANDGEGVVGGLRQSQHVCDLRERVIVGVGLRVKRRQEKDSGAVEAVEERASEEGGRVDFKLSSYSLVARGGRT